MMETQWRTRRGGKETETDDENGEDCHLGVDEWMEWEEEGAHGGAGRSEEQEQKW